MKTFNNQTIDRYETSNYFGGQNGETDEQVHAMRVAWTSAMIGLGYEMDQDISDEDQFERDSETALGIAMRQVFATA